LHAKLSTPGTAEFYASELPDAVPHKTIQLTSDPKEVSMKNKLFGKASMIAIPMGIACFLLASGAPATAQQQNLSTLSQGFEPSCSNQTLVGNYGFTIEGTILDANLQIRGLALQHYDGRGHITQLDHLVTGGYPPPQAWTRGTGTYSVNPDCTGSAVIISPSSAPPGSSGPPPPLNIHFIIVGHGTQIKQVVDANAVVANGVKVH
jgi:hypothetical protein